MIQSFCFRVLLLASFTFCLSSILIQRIVEIRIRTYFYALYFSLVVQFSRIISPLGSAPLARDLVIIPLSERFVNTFLKTFSKFFQGLSCLSSRYLSPSLVGRACILYYDAPLLSRTFSHFSPLLSLFGSFHNSCATFYMTFWVFSVYLEQKISFLYKFRIHFLSKTGESLLLKSSLHAKYIQL